MNAIAMWATEWVSMCDAEKWCEAWTSITIPYVNNLCRALIVLSQKNERTIKMIYIWNALWSTIYISHTRAEYLITGSTVTDTIYWHSTDIANRKSVGGREVEREQRVFPTHVYFSFYCYVPRTITFSSHTRITSIDSRKPSAINYVKNVCKENGKTGTCTTNKQTNIHTHSGDDTLD